MYNTKLTEINSKLNISKDISITNFSAASGAMDGWIRLIKIGKRVHVISSIHYSKVVDFVVLAETNSVVSSFGSPIQDTYSPLFDANGVCGMIGINTDTGLRVTINKPGTAIKACFDYTVK